jgi:putative flippase GtrA
MAVLKLAYEAPVVEIVVPVYNEAADLERSIRHLDAFLDVDFPFTARITVVDNASTDGTLMIAQRLSAELGRVDVIHLDAKGRGRALQAAWTTSEAYVLAYMDVDLATDLSALLPLIAPLVSGHSDIAIGSRLLRGANVVRGAKREIISRGYNLLLRFALGARFSDAQCGFKAIRADVAQRLLPRVEDQGWFFDTELLVLAQRAGLRIHEVAVDWREDPDSRVDLVPTALDDLRGIARVAREHASGRVLAGLEDMRRFRARGPALFSEARSFAAIGVLSTLAYVALFAVLRNQLPVGIANALALLVTTIANTAANRRFTFAVRGRAHQVQHHLAGLVAFGFALAITSGALVILAALNSSASPAIAISVLMATNAIATAVRFAVLRTVLKRGTQVQRSAQAGLMAGPSA